MTTRYRTIYRLVLPKRGARRGSPDYGLTYAAIPKMTTSATASNDRFFASAYERPENQSDA